MSDRQHFQDRLKSLLGKHQVLITDTHVILSQKDGQGRWRHSDTYFNKNLLSPFPAVQQTIGTMLACISKEMMSSDAVRGGPFTRLDGFTGTAVGGVILSHETTKSWNHQFRPHDAEHLINLFAEKEGEGFLLKRGYDKLAENKNFIIVEDVLTTGGSVKKVAQVIREAGGNVIGVVAICNRGGVTAADVGVPVLDQIMSMEAQAWAEGEVPDWLAGRPIRKDIGHGKQYELSLR